jgi:DHA2 family multidrug resistance protein
MTLATDYSHYAWARALQGLGYAFFFVPLTMLAYSNLRPDQNNRASSMTNFFRNWGGSFGIALTTTMADRRQDFHENRVGANITASTPWMQQRVLQTAKFLESHGYSHADALGAAYAKVYAQFQAQARFLAFMDCFHILAVLTLCAVPLLLFTRTFSVGGKAPAGH